MHTIPRLIFFGLSCSMLNCFAKESKPADQSAQDQPARHVTLDGQPNFRDIGGYKTKDGHTVAWGKVFRTGDLQKLSDQDVKKLGSLGVKTVVNFLSELEVKSQEPDRLPEGVKEIFLPIDGAQALGGDFMVELMTARKTGDFSMIPASVNPDIHRATVIDGKKQYAELIRTLADTNSQPLVFHCSHGVHRTGTAAAIILSAVGVPWETIQEDYLLSNKYRSQINKKRIQQLKKTYAESKNIPESAVDTKDIEAFYILQGEYIDASLEQTVKDYGSMENYIRSGLGISDETLKKLKKNLLTE